MNFNQEAFLGLLIIVIIITIAVLLRKKKQAQKKAQTIEKVQETAEQTNTVDIPYRKKYLLTKNEWSFYKELLKEIDQEKQVIIAKIRLADLIEVDTAKTEQSERLKYFQKISQKHIDFGICKKENLEVIKLIELDDSTHNSKERMERDFFVDKALKKCGYIVIHVNSIEEYRKMIR